MQIGIKTMEKCCSKHPSFSQMHLNHLNDLDSAHDSGKLSFILYTKGYHKEPFSYTGYDDNLNQFCRTTRINFRLPFQKYHILGSCNGLVCFNAILDNKSVLYEPAYICNPITREYIVLPKIEGKTLLSGFGYSPSTNEYKVVRICRCRGDPCYGITQVNTLASGIGWRNGRKMDYDVRSFIPFGVFANGAIHWVDGKGTIAAFDLIDEEFRELPSLPPPAIVELHVLGDFLCARYYHSEGYDIWVLKKNKSNHDVIWSKEFSNIHETPINFTKSGGLLCYDYRHKNYYRYAPTASSSRMLVNFGNNFIVGVSHKNTLVSLKALGEEDMELLDSGERARSSGEIESSDR